MKRMNALCLTTAIVLTAMAGLHVEAAAVTSNKAPALEEGVPLSFELPRGFKKPDKNTKSMSLGLFKFAGITLDKYEGTYPIYVTKAGRKQIPNQVLKPGDVILAVNGKVLTMEGAKQVRAAVRSAKEEGGFVWFTRWRPAERNAEYKAEVERCFMLLSDENLDLTKVLAPGPGRDWRLGPLGANGWCINTRTRLGGTADARQFLITAVDKDGPAAGRLLLKDVIIGVDDKLFTYDARKALSAAINEAEKKENKGQLKLKIFRQGTVMDVTIALPVMGTYSDTAPFNCPKTGKIIEDAVAYMKAHAEELLAYQENGWINYINGLGLLATGRDDVMPLVRKLAHDSILADDERLSVDEHVSMQCWWWSYKTIFLCEYYLRTKDATVLPTIDALATAIAMGQSGAGTWGHTYAARSNTGYLHGHLGGYGAINQQGLTLMIGLPLAVKCGVKNQEVMDAITRGNNFFKFFIGKGTIPYGDHGPASHWYDDNGKSGSAAIFFDLMDNREGAQFFSEMVLGAAPGGRDVGHTGHYWSHLWGGIGAARGGDRVLQAFMKEMNPIFTLERQPNGRFAFQDNPGENGPIGDPKEKWDCTGARLLQLCVPRRALYITGKETPKETHLTSERIEEILAAGRLYVSKKARAELSLDEILTLLRDPLPTTRNLAADALAERNVNCVDRLIAMLDSDDKYARYGAVTALGKAGFGNKAAADRLIAIMQTSKDLTLQTYAIGALTNRDKERGLLSVAEPAIPVLMKMALEQSPDDPRKVLQSTIASALFYDGRAKPRRGLFPEYGLDGVDRSLLVKAIREILTNENGAARSVVAKWIYAKLTQAERDQLWGDIYQSTQNIAPSGIMFASAVQTEGMKLMSEHHIEEGLALAVWYVRYQKFHGSQSRMPTVLEVIEGYGAHAKRFIPELKKHASYYENHPKPPVRKSAEFIRATIKKLEALPDEPALSLVSIADKLEQSGIVFPPKPIVLQ